jgi:hypothetical protein
MKFAKIKLTTTAVLLTLCMSVNAQISLNADGYYPGEGITYDTLTEKYTIKYLREVETTGRMITLYYQPPNKIKPTMRMRLLSNRGRDLTYSFNVGNERAAKQAMYSFSMYTQTPWFEKASLITNSDATAHASTGNMGSATQALESRFDYTTTIEEKRMKQPVKWLPEVQFAKTNKAFAMSWQAHPNEFPLDDIQPGQRRVGFGIVAPYLPGLVEFGFQGATEPLKLPGSAGGDSKIWEDIRKLKRGVTDPVPQLDALGPKILIPEPFNTKLLAKAISDDLASWVTAGQLSESLAQRLRLTLAAAGDAAERNIEDGVEGHVKQIFIEIFGRHKGMDHKEFDEEREEKRADQPELSYLAARAIGFNASELLKRYSYANKRSEDKK